MNSRKDFLNRSVNLKVMAYLYNNQGCNVVTLCKKLDYTFAHVFRCIKYLKECDLIVLRKKGRNLIIKLSLNGMELSKTCHELINLINKVQ